MRAFQLLIDFFDLFLTLRPSMARDSLRPQMQGARRLKVFGAPHFGGGPASKMVHLREMLAKKGEPYSHVLCLSAVRVPIFLLWILRWRGAKVLVNQNGVYYPNWMPEGYEARNQFLAKLNRAAHHSFFQSEFALNSYKKWVGEPPASFSILHNPVDQNRFRPSEKNSAGGKPTVLFFMDIGATSLNAWSYFTSLLLGNMAEAQNYRWLLVGRASKEMQKNSGASALLKSGLEVKAHWNPEAAEIPALLASADLLFYPRYNDVCPNKVLECLASGLPVVGLSAGGTKELVGHAGKILSVVEDYGPPQYPESASVWAALAEISAKLHSYRNEALSRAGNLSLRKWQKAIEEKMVNG